MNNSYQLMLSDIDTQINESDVNRLQAILKIQTIAIKAIHDFFEDQDFLQIMPVILSKNTDPVSNGEEVEFEPGTIMYQDQELKLTQSMILNKQIAIGSGLDKIYVFSPNIRLERPDKYYTGKHLIEFTQVDLEVAHAEMVDILKLIESLIRRIRIDITTKAANELRILKRKINTWDESFPIYTVHQMEEDYGENWFEDASKTHTTPYFVICFNRHFYDKTYVEDGVTHYFNYSMFYPEGYGIALSGSQREYDFEKLVARMKSLKLRMYDYNEFLLYSQAGRLRPSAGAGFGVERLIRFLTGSEHIGDIQLFRRVPGEQISI